MIYMRRPMMGIWTRPIFGFSNPFPKLAKRLDCGIDRRFLGGMGRQPVTNGNLPAIFPFLTCNFN